MSVTKLCRKSQCQDEPSYPNPFTTVVNLLLRSTSIKGANQGTYNIPHVLTHELSLPALCQTITQSDKTTGIDSMRAKNMTNPIQHHESGMCKECKTKQCQSVTANTRNFMLYVDIGKSNVFVREHHCNL
eukprot:6023902-Amphidinium_carterae.1